MTLGASPSATTLPGKARARQAVSALRAGIVSALGRLATHLGRRAPDFIIGGNDPYLLRWFVIPRNPVFNIYYHEIVRSDDDRALHDHPWWNASIILSGEYTEHTIERGGIHRRTVRRAGSVKFRRATAAHRLEVSDRCCTLFITGPRLRSWGFHCPEAGWRHWRDFTSGERGETVGRGCE